MPISPNAARAYAYLTGRGFSPVAAAGMVGNLIAESGGQLNVKALGDRSIPGGSQGVGQWNRDRAVAMRAHTDPSARDELERQLSYLVKELDTREKGAGARLRSAKDIVGGTAGGISFERPAGYTAANPQGGHNWAGRLANARAVLASQTGQNPVVASGPAAPATGPVGEGAASPVAAAPEPPDYLAQGLQSILDAAAPAPLTPASPMQEAGPAPAVVAEADPEPPAPAAPAAPGPPPQSTAASLMASLLDRKRAERGGLLDLQAGMFG